MEKHMDFYDYWILRTNVNSNLKIRLVKEYENSKNVFNNIVLNKNLEFINLEQYGRFVKMYEELKETFDIIQYNKILSKHSVKFTKITDNDYPNKLKNIEHPPFILFYKGNIKLVDLYSLSVIGTRNSTPYGEEVCKKIAKELSLNGVNIVSGGARGIDILSHKVCIENMGFPICILGSGLLNYYPKENSAYFDKISEMGCLISEYDLYVKPSRYNFPERNRINKCDW